MTEFKLIIKEHPADYDSERDRWMGLVQDIEDQLGDVLADAYGRGDIRTKSAEMLYYHVIDALMTVCEHRGVTELVVYADDDP